MSFKDPHPPNHFAVKGDNGKFLMADSEGGRTFLRFKSNVPDHEEIIKVPGAKVECYWIRNKDNYWCRDRDDFVTDHRILDPIRENLEDMKFSVEKLNNEEYWTIKNLGNNMLCKRAALGSHGNFLKADVKPDVSPIPAVAKFELKEVPPYPLKDQAEASDLISERSICV